MNGGRIRMGLSSWRVPAAGVRRGGRPLDGAEPGMRGGVGDIAGAKATMDTARRAGAVIK